MKQWFKAAFGAAFLLPATPAGAQVLPAYPSIPYTLAQPQDYVQLNSPRFTYSTFMSLGDMASWAWKFPSVTTPNALIYSLGSGLGVGGAGPSANGTFYWDGSGHPQAGALPAANGGTSGWTLNAIPYGGGAGTLPSFVAACASGLLTYTSGSVPICATTLPNGLGTYVINVKNPAYGAKGDGITDDGPAFSAAISACPTTGGCTIFVPNACPNYYKIATGFTLPGHVGLLGEANIDANIHSPMTCGSLLVNASGGAMITLPGSSVLTSSTSVGQSFSHIGLDGGNLNQPIIYAPEQNPGRGSWSVSLDHIMLAHGRPCISAQNAWDWSISSFSLVGCGNMPGGATLPLQSAIYVYNSAQTYSGANSNSWRITDGFIDTTSARAFVFDSSGNGGTDEGFRVKNVHTGPQGYESIYGCVSSSNFDIFTEGTVTGYAPFNLFVPGGRGGCGGNSFAGSTIINPGINAVIDGQAADNLSGMTMYPQPSSGNPYISITTSGFYNTISNNKTEDNPCCNNTAIVADSGTGTTIYNNDGSDGIPINNEKPEKVDGTAYQSELSTSAGMQTYSPTIGCGSGSITTLGTVSGRWKQVANLVFVEIVIPITTNGTCASYLTSTLPANPTHSAALSARETTGAQGNIASVSSGSALLFDTKYDGTYPGFNGASITISGWYEDK